MTLTVVPRAGVEPATLGLEVLCSIQLSYRGIDPIITPYGVAEFMIKSVASRKSMCQGRS